MVLKVALNEGRNLLVLLQLICNRRRKALAVTTPLIFPCRQTVLKVSG